MDMSRGTIHISAYQDKHQDFNESTLQKRFTQANAEALKANDVAASKDAGPMENEQVRYRGQSYSKEALQNRLRQELDMLRAQLKNCDEEGGERNSIVIATYEEMIRRRQKEYEAALSF